MSICLVQKAMAMTRPMSLVYPLPEDWRQKGFPLCLTLGDMGDTGAGFQWKV